MNDVRNTMIEVARNARARYDVARERSPFGIGFMLGAIVGFLVAWVF